jgi:dTMP kinase
MSTGVFIALDGIDGAGKSSQIAALATWLRHRGINVATCRDPGSTSVGEALRALLRGDGPVPMAPVTEMLLFMASRAQLVHEVIAPALARGEWVVSDRYLLANIVYQGYGSGVDLAAIRAVGEVATNGVMPDLVLVLRVGAATAKARLDRPLDRLENRGDAYRGRIDEGYSAEAARDPARLRVIDADGTMEEVAERIRAAIIEQFPTLK